MPGTPLRLDATGKRVELLHEAFDRSVTTLRRLSEAKSRYGVGTEAPVRDLAARHGSWPDVALDNVEAAVKEAVLAAADSGATPGTCPSIRLSRRRDRPAGVSPRLRRRRRAPGTGLDRRRRLVAPERPPNA
jgi:hypothetical protein